MSQQFDLIIIGDSTQGNAAVKHIAGAKNTIKAAFISKTFKRNTTHDFLNVEYIRDDVLLIDYKNRLFGCYLSSGKRLYSTHIIIASGLAYKPFMVNNNAVPNVFNTTDEIGKTAKSLQAVVIGKTDADVKFAQAVAKKYKYVYFCTESFNTGISESAIKKLADIDNLVVLPNTSITKFCTNNGVLSSLELSNYSTLTCSAIFVKTEATPETYFINNKLFEMTDSGHILTSSNLESTLIPNGYAVGNCTVKSTKKMMQEMYNKILADF